MWPTRKNKEDKIIVHGQGRFSPIRVAEISLAGQRSNICLFLLPPGRFMNSHLFSKDCWESTKASALTMGKTRPWKKTTTFVQLPELGLLLWQQSTLEAPIFPPPRSCPPWECQMEEAEAAAESSVVASGPSLLWGAKTCHKAPEGCRPFWISLSPHTDCSHCPLCHCKTQPPSSDAAVTAQSQGPYLLPPPTTELSFSLSHWGPRHASQRMECIFSLEPCFL